MSIQARVMTRVFVYNGLHLPDLDSRLTPEQIRDAYATVYPEITTAAIEGPEAVDGTLRYKLMRAIGTKG